MLQIAFFSMLWTLALSGWGLIVFRRTLDTMDLPRTSIFGLAVLVGHLPLLALGYLLHLFIPLNPVVGWTSLGLGLILLALNIRLLRTPALAMLFGTVGFISAFAARQIVHGDSGYYAVPAIHWTVAEPVVRGLANLDPTFGYNSSWWILSAIYSGPVGLATAVQMVSVPFLAGIGILIFTSAHCVWVGRGTWFDWFAIPAVYLWLRQVVGVNTPSPSADIPANLCTVLALGFLVRSLQHRRLKPANPQSLSRLPSLFASDGMVFVALSVLAFSAKLSAALLLAVAAMWGVLSLARVPKQVSVRQNLAPLFVFAALITTQLIHGFFLSGYPLFPATVGGWWDVPWRVHPEVPGETVARARDWAQTFGATAEQISQTPRWRLWIERQGAATNILVAAGIGLAGLLGMGYVLLKNKKEALGASCLLIPALISAGLLAWNFYHAPALRFGAGYAFALLGCFAAFSGPLLPHRLARPAPLLWTLLCILALQGPIQERPVRWITPAALPKSEFSIRYTKQGEAIHIPEDGLAWIGPLPSCPEFEFNLQLLILRDKSNQSVKEISVSTQPDSEGKTSQDDRRRASCLSTVLPRESD